MVVKVHLLLCVAHRNVALQLSTHREQMLRECLHWDVKEFAQIGTPQTDSETN